MKNTCKYCKYYSTEYFLGDYASPMCSLYGMLEEVGNPHYDLDATKCKDFTIELTSFSDLNIPSEKYQWYKENEEKIEAFFMECFEE